MTKDMTEGRIIPQLTEFTIPLVLGNLFQLTYNAADSVIVGKFVGDDALAAVGTAGPIMNMVILFISGMCMGAGILMSTQYGAKKYNLLERPWLFGSRGGPVDPVRPSSPGAAPGSGRYHRRREALSEDHLCGADLYICL